MHPQWFMSIYLIYVNYIICTKITFIKLFRCYIRKRKCKFEAD